MKVQRNGREFTVDVTADGDGVVSHAGAALLAETADRIGLTDALSEGLAPMRRRRGAHDPGRVVRDLAVLASGGSHLSDLGAVRDQEPLFGAVASDATAWRAVEAIGEDPVLMGALRGARRVARRLQRQETVTKQAIRDFHARQREALLERSRPFIDRWEDKIIGEFADGHEVNPRKIRPVVERVDGDGFDAALFRFATLHWSIPVSVGYGRRTRFLVRDRSNEKLIGVFALGDPVYNLRSRDAEIEWGIEQRNARLYNVLDAFVLGALPPYRELLGGKLVAMAATCTDTADLIEEKYLGTRTVISKKKKDPRPVLITTTSALGRSSLLNRLKYRGRLLYSPIGYTKGFGHFQFSDKLFAELCEFLSEDGGVPSYEYGHGPNWRLRTLRLGLRKIGIDDELLQHGIRRQVYLAPLATNWKRYLRGDTDSPQWYRLRLNEMAAFYRRRWAIPRSERDASFMAFDHDRMRLSDE